jgi:hypothetical protein
MFIVLTLATAVAFATPGTCGPCQRVLCGDSADTEILTAEEGRCCPTHDSCPPRSRERSEDVFDIYDDDLNHFLTKKDLEQMTTYMHIWDETNSSADGNLTFAEIQAHAQEYNLLWDRIVDAIKALDYDNDTAITPSDIARVRENLLQAQANLDHWTTELDNAKSTFGLGPEDNLNITFWELNDHANNAKADFKHSMTSSFERLGGSENSGITTIMMKKNKQNIALLLAAFEDLFENEYTNITRDTYDEKLREVDRIIEVKFNATTNARNALIHGSMPPILFPSEQEL